MQSEAIKRKRQTLRRVLNTFFSKTVSVNFDVLNGLFFYARYLQGSKKMSLMFLHLFITLERTEKNKNAYTVFELHYIGTFFPNLSGWKFAISELKTCAQFLENKFFRKRAKQFQRRSSGWLRLKQHSVKVINCGLQTNGSTYFITIALRCWRDNMPNAVLNLIRHLCSTRHCYSWSLAPMISCYCRIKSVLSQFPEFSFPWLVICIMNRPKQC